MSIVHTRKLVPILTAAVALAAVLTLTIDLPWQGVSSAEGAENGNAATEMIINGPDGETTVLVASVEQEAALADGVVTFEEYEAATWAFFTCMTDQGVEAREEPHLDATGTRFEHSVILTGNPAEDARIGRVVTECKDQHLIFVEFAYATQDKPSETTIAGARSALLACLIDAGFPETDNLDELVANRGHDIEAFAACSEQVSQEFGIPNFAG